MLNAQTPETPTTNGQAAPTATTGFRPPHMAWAPRATRTATVRPPACNYTATTGFRPSQEAWAPKGKRTASRIGGYSHSSCCALFADAE